MILAIRPPIPINRFKRVDEGLDSIYILILAHGTQQHWDKLFKVAFMYSTILNYLHNFSNAYWLFVAQLYQFFQGAWLFTHCSLLFAFQSSIPYKAVY